MGNKGHPSSSFYGELEAPAIQLLRWSASTRIAFRFGFLYFALLNLDLILRFLPFPPFTWLSWLFGSTRGEMVRWVSKHVLHLSHDFATDYLIPANGSKDTTFDWVMVFCYLVIAAIATLIWSVCDRKRQEYVRLHTWFLLLLRASLATGLITYGTTKLFPHQFPPLTPSQVVGVLGNSTPNELLWIFMGVSQSYSFFGGMMEVVPALMLMIPRLATLGALMSAAVVGNVLMLNFGYDIGAKLLAINLGLMGMVILLPDLRRLVDFLVLNQSVCSVPERPLLRRKSLNRAMLVLQIAFGVLLLSYNLYSNYQMTSQIAASRKTPLYGIWFVDEFQINGQVRPPLSDNPHRWQRMMVNYADNVVVQVMTGATQFLYPRFDPHTRTLVLTEPGDPSWIAKLTYDDSTPGSLVLSGKMGGLPVLIRLHREDESKFPINKRGLHWAIDAVK